MLYVNTIHVCICISLYISTFVYIYLTSGSCRHGTYTKMGQNMTLSIKPNFKQYL